MENISIELLQFLKIGGIFVIKNGTVTEILYVIGITGYSIIIIAIVGMV